MMLPNVKSCNLTKIIILQEEINAISCGIFLLNLPSVLRMTGVTLLLVTTLSDIPALLCAWRVLSGSVLTFDADMLTLVRAECVRCPAAWLGKQSL